MRSLLKDALSAFKAKLGSFKEKLSEIVSWRTVINGVLPAVIISLGSWIVSCWRDFQSLDVYEVAQECADSIVIVRANEGASMGSGFVAECDGRKYIYTARHVIRDCNDPDKISESIEVTRNSAADDAKIPIGEITCLQVDRNSLLDYCRWGDVARIEISDDTSIPALKIADDNKSPKKNDTIFLLRAGEEGKMKPDAVEGKSMQVNDYWIFHSIPARKGQSGVPILNTKGEVVAVESALVVMRNGKKTEYAENIAFRLLHKSSWGKADDKNAFKYTTESAQITNDVNEIYCTSSKSGTRIQYSCFLLSDSALKSAIGDDIRYAEKLLKTDVSGDWAKAIKILKKLAKRDIPEGQFDLSCCYLTGKGVQQDSKLAFEWCLMAASNNLGKAQYNLASFYNSGCEGACEVDKEEELYWLEKAVSNNVAEAMAMLGEYKFYDGDANGIQLLKMAVERNNADAAALLGFAYERGMMVEESGEKAFELYLKAAEDGSIQGMKYLSVCYDYGIGTPSNLTKAAEWCLKAASKGDAIAQAEIANYYLGRWENQRKDDFGANAEPRPIDTEKGIHWLRESSQNGNVYAMYELASWLSFSNDPRDVNECDEWLYKASTSTVFHVEHDYRSKDRGNYSHSSRFRMLNIAESYQGGNNSEMYVCDYSRWYFGLPWAQYALGNRLLSENKAVTNGNAVITGEELIVWSAGQGWAPAQTRTAELFEEDNVTSNALEYALFWYKKAASQFYDPALYALGCIYAEGRIVKKDISMAVECWSKAAESGENFARIEWEQDILAYLWWTHDWIWDSHIQMTPFNPENRFMKFQWNAWQVLLGYAPAQYKLGECYEKGLLGEVDIEKAKKYYTQAAYQGFSEAINRLKALDGHKAR